MVAPADAKATFVAGGETITLAMNFRTIALAEDARPDCVVAFGRGKPTLSGSTALVWAFAQPAHPDLSQDAALTLMMTHGEAAVGALTECFRLATAGTEAPDEPAANPPRRRTSR